MRTISTRPRTVRHTGETIQYNMRIDAAIWQRLRDIAARENRSLNNLLLRIITAYIERDRASIMDGTYRPDHRA